MRYGKALLTTLLLGSLCAAATADEVRAQAAATAESRSQAGSRSSGQASVATQGRAGLDTEATLRRGERALQGTTEFASSTSAALQAEVARAASSTIQAAIQQEVRMSVQAEITGLVSCGLGR